MRVIKEDLFVLLLILDEKVSTFFPLNIMLGVYFLYMAVILLRYVPSMPNLWSIFIVKGCCVLSNDSSISSEMIEIFVFNFLKKLHLLYMLNHSYIPGINLTWS